jgi:uroporphyrinogen-III synthase
MKPLAGRRVVITRAADQAGATADLIASFGATPVVVPLIEVVDEPGGSTALSALDLGDLDWIVVTSPNGANRLSPLLAPSAARPRVAAVGSATAAALPRCDLVATTQSAVGLLEVFPPGPGRVAVVQAVDAAATLVDGLTDKAWEVVAISPYRTVSRVPSADQRLAALGADALLLASGSAAKGWVDALGTQTPPVVVAIGEQTAAVAREAGLKITTVSADHSVYGMLVSLGRYFTNTH